MLSQATIDCGYFTPVSYTQRPVMFLLECFDRFSTNTKGDCSLRFLILYDVERSFSALISPLKKPLLASYMNKMPAVDALLRV